VSDPPSAPNDSFGTLYDPPSGTEEVSSTDDDSVRLRLTLSEDQADQLQSVAQQLGLTPSTVAQRAIKMVCDEVVTIQEDNRPPHLLVDQYQARIDLLHAVGDGDSSADETSPQTGEHSSGVEETTEP
jgi:hypothetical protein